MRLPSRGRPLCRWGGLSGLLLIGSLAAAPTATAAAKTFTVTDMTDAPLLVAGTGVCVSSAPASDCTLRAAIQAADDVGGPVSISLPAGVLTLAIPPSTGGGSADDPSTGDLDSDGLNGAPSPQITLTGMGPGVTTIDANQIDRIFTVHPGASLSISGVTLKNGLAPAANVLDPFDGGAIDSEGSLTISDSLLTGNAGGGEGGGVYSAAGDVTITDTTIAANTATTAGGGLADGGTGVVTLIDDTFDSNDFGTGGGIAYFGVPTASGSIVQNVTVAHNTGGIDNPSRAGTIENTIVADNTGTTGVAAAQDCVDPNPTDHTDLAGPADVGGNLDSDRSCFVAGVAGDVTAVDPKLAPLADNGGGPPTDALLAGSPAIFQALSVACPLSDERGVARISAFCDSGAYQADEADLSVQGSGPSSAQTGQQILDTFTIANAGPYGAGVTLTDALPAGTTLDQATLVGGSCTGGATITCTLATLAAAQSATASITFTVDSAGTVTNQASVNTSALDADTQNDTATVVTGVSGSTGGSGVPAGTPVNTAAPTITGAGSGEIPQGTTLTAHPGVWSNHPSFSYQWQDCDGSSCSPAGGATATTYTVDSSDGGLSVRVVVTARTAAGLTAMATSDKTQAVSESDSSGESNVKVSAPQANGTTATVGLSCPDAFSCSLLLFLEALGARPASVHDVSSATTVRSHRPRHPPVVFGRTAVRIRAGSHKSVRITLNRAGKRRLAKLGTLKTRLVVEQSGRTVRTVTVTFKTKHRKRHR
jgi:hypothetical protein